MMNDLEQRLSWLEAIHQAANKQYLSLPPFTDRGMGSAILPQLGGGPVCLGETPTGVRPGSRQRRGGMHPVARK
jgi:hypothetical protein